MRRAVVAVAFVLLAAGCSHPAPLSPVARACGQIAAEYAVSGASAVACVRCTERGAAYMWFMDPGRFECNG